VQLVAQRGDRLDERPARDGEVDPAEPLGGLLLGGVAPQRVVLGASRLANRSATSCSTWAANAASSR
jgi:hypothetical protein